MHTEQPIILLTDDDDDDRYFLRQAIERVVAGVSVVEARNGDEALNLLATGRLINLVVLDMNMPGLSGLEILSLIRLNVDLCHTPAVMLSTSDQPSLVADAYRKGINCYIKKPVMLGEYDLIANALKTCFLTIPL